MFTTVGKEDKKSLTGLEKFGYVFDWTVPTSETAVTVAYCTDGDTAGMVEYERQPENLCDYLWLIEVSDAYKGKGVAGKLLAYVGRDALEAGFDGFVVFEAKTVLFQYYQVKYGAKPIGGRRLFFDTDATKALIKTYLEGD